MTLRNTRLLVVDDDPHMMRMITRILELEDCHVIGAVTGEEGLSLLTSESPDLVLLDVMLPGEDGFTICRRLREHSTIPVVVVTALTAEDAKVKGLEIGADDYVTKPFSARELVARVKAVLRRTSPLEEHPKPLIRCGGLEIDMIQHKVTLNGQDVGLNATEYKLLSYLARNAGMVVTPNQLLGAVWGENYIGNYHLVRVNISRLRQKLGDSHKKSKVISTRIGIGYIFGEGQSNRD